MPGPALPGGIDHLAAVPLVKWLQWRRLQLLIGLWASFGRGPVDRDRFVRFAAATVCAFVALGKVLSPQYLIWLVPLVPLVRGRRGFAACALLATAFVLTQIWFSFRYWGYPTLHFDALASWAVLARDLVLAALLAVLAWQATTDSGLQVQVPSPLPHD